MRRALVLAALLMLARAPGASAQSVGSDLLRGGVPTGTATEETVALTLDQAIERGLVHNLGLIVGEERAQAADGAHAEARSDLLPHLRAGASAVRQKISLAAFGFSGLGDFPDSSAPSTWSTPVVTRPRPSSTCMPSVTRESEGLLAEAAHQQQRNTRDTVVLACAGLYLQALAGESRIEAARAQLATAEALLEIASDRKKSGLVAGVDVLRAQVQLAAQRQHLIVAEKEAAEQKLALAHAIGLPLGQAFRLADDMPFSPAPAIAPEEALQRAYATRADLQAAESRVRAAEQARRAAAGEGLPSLGVTGEYGFIGNTASSALGTFAVGAGLRVPLFEGGKVQAKVKQADARLREAEAALADRRATVYYDVRSTLLDLTAAAERVSVATSALDLAGQQLTQARDRFAAGSGRQPRRHPGPGSRGPRVRGSHPEPLRAQRLQRPPSRARWGWPRAAIASS